MYCWGANDRAQVSAPASAWALKPRAIDGDFGTSVSQLAVGDGFGCAIAAGTGQLRCWGTVPLSVGSDASVMAAGVRALAVGGRHGCLAIGQGESGTSLLQCFGENDRGQLGFDGDGSALINVRTANGDPLTVTGFRGISAGSAHTCAYSDSRIWCWGANESNQLGRHPPPGLLESAAATVNFRTEPQSIVDLSAAGETTCAVVNVDNSGTMTDAGTDQDVAQTDASSTDVADTDVTDGQSSDGGDPIACNVLPSGNGLVVCWGSLVAGLSSRRCNTTLPVLIRRPSGEPLIGARRVFTGSRHACAMVGADRTVYCWGDAADARMPGTTDRGAMTAVPVRTLDGTLELAITGSGNSVPAGVHRREREVFCSRFESSRNAAQVQCWGPNDFGQVGNPDRARTLQEMLGDVQW